MLVDALEEESVKRGIKEGEEETENALEKKNELLRE